MSNTIQLLQNGQPVFPVTDASVVTGISDVAKSGDYDDLDNKPTIPAAQVQTDWNASSGMGVLLNKPNLATVATSGSYNDLSNKPTIPTVPTISTNIQTDKDSTTKTAAPSAVYNEVHPAIATTQPQGGFLPNVVYDLGTITDTTFALASASDATIPNAYFWTFETGSTAPTINWPNGVTWAGGSAPTVNASCHYEILIRNGYGTALEFDIS